MTLTILGEHGPYPPPNGACSGYLLSDGVTKILFDAGPGVFSRLLAATENLVGLSAVVLSHLHMDHCSDALAMRYLLDRKGLAVPLYLPDEPCEIVSLFKDWGGENPRIINENEAAQIGGMKLRFFPMRHPVKAFGIRATSSGATFAYTGDTNTAQVLPALLKGADLALLDACFTDEQWSENLPHLSARLAAKAAAEAGVKLSVLTHLNPDTPRTALLAQAKEENAAVALAQAGDVHSFGSAPTAR